MQVAAASNPKKDFAFTIGTLTELGQKATGGRLRAMARGSAASCTGAVAPKNMLYYSGTAWPWCSGRCLGSSVMKFDGFLFKRPNVDQVNWLHFSFIFFVSLLILK